MEYIFLFWIIIIYFLWIFFSSNSLEYFNESKPSIYIVWNDEIDKQGLGDKIRGAISIYQYCKENNYNCFFNAQHSKIGKFLLNYDISSNISKDTKIHQLLNVYDKPNALSDFINQVIKESSNNEIIAISTNLIPKEPISKDDINFLENIMKPNNKLQKKIDKINNSLPNNYTIQHYRFKDHSEPDDNICEKCCQTLLSSYSETDILMSNSNKFKNYVKTRIPNIYTLEPKTSNSEMHIGLNQDESIVEFTLIEYNIIKKAKKIKTYSEYNWISAFVLWPSKIYNIPLKIVALSK